MAGGGVRGVALRLGAQQVEGELRAGVNEETQGARVSSPAASEGQAKA